MARTISPDSSGIALSLLLTIVVSFALWADDEISPELEINNLSGLPIHVTPGGTFLRDSSSTIYLPGVQLPEQIVTILSQAAATVVTRRVAHLLLTLVLGHADKFLGRSGYEFLIRRYQDGSLMIPVNFWHYWVRIHRIWNGVIKLTDELGRRTMNVAGLERIGRMPVYPGVELDQAVYIDAVLENNMGGDAQQKLEIIPVKTVSPELILSPWQREVAALSNTALENNVDFIRLTLNNKRLALAEWHECNGEWFQSTLYKADTDIVQDRYLLHWLPHSYRHDSTEQNNISLLEPAGLRCITGRLLDRSVSCVPLNGLTRRWSHNAYLLEARTEGLPAGFLHIYNNPSWSPGLPGVMALAADQFSGLQAVNESRQYRLPEWGAWVGEALIYEVAVTLAENTVGAAMEKVNSWWHGAGGYKVTQHLTSDLNQRGEVRAEVERVKDKNKISWVRKSVQWYDPEGELPENYQYLTLARERQILSELNHPNIVKVHDSWIENAGTNKARLVLIEDDAGVMSTKRYPKCMDEYRQLMRGTLRALEAAHKQGIAHYDIKPDNILVNDFGHISLADFGEAMHLDKSGRAMVDAATPEFIAPETITKQSTVPWQADIWGLGTAGVQFARALGIPAADGAWLRLSEANRSRKLFALSEHMTSADDPGDGEGLVDFLGQMLTFDYWKRGSYESLLKHEFLNPEL